MTHIRLLVLLYNCLERPPIIFPFSKYYLVEGEGSYSFDVQLAGDASEPTTAQLAFNQFKVSLTEATIGKLVYVYTWYICVQLLFVSSLCRSCRHCLLCIGLPGSYGIYYKVLFKS